MEACVWCSGITWLMNKCTGPCGIETIKKLLADGTLTPDTPVCDQSIGDLIGTRLMKPMNWTKHCMV